MQLAWSVAYHGYEQGAREHLEQAQLCESLLGGNNQGRINLEWGSNKGEGLPLSSPALQVCLRGLSLWHREQVEHCRAGVERMRAVLAKNGLEPLSPAECKCYKQNVPAGAKAVRSCVERSSVAWECEPCPAVASACNEQGQRSLF